MPHAAWDNHFFIATVELGLAQDSSGRCTDVSIGLFIHEIENVNVKEQSMDCEFYLYLRWKGVHSPKDYEFVNGTNIQKLFEVQETDRLGREIISAKIRGTFKSNFDLSKYPLDSHLLHIELEDFDWAEDSLRYSIDSLNTGISPDLSIGEWTIKSMGPSIKSQYFPPSKRYFTHFDYSLSIERKPAPFVLKILIPLLIVVAMSMLSYAILLRNITEQGFLLVLGTSHLGVSPRDVIVSCKYGTSHLQFDTCGKVFL